MPRRDSQPVSQNRGACAYCLKTTTHRCRICGPICRDCDRVFHDERWIRIAHCQDHLLDGRPQCRSEVRAYAHNQKIINTPWSFRATTKTPTTAPSSPDGTGLGRIVGSVSGALSGTPAANSTGATDAPATSATIASPSTSSTPRLSTLDYPPAARLLSWRLTHSLYEPKPRTRKARGATAKQRSRSRKSNKRSFSEEECSHSESRDSC